MEKFLKLNIEEFYGNWMNLGIDGSVINPKIIIMNLKEANMHGYPFFKWLFFLLILQFVLSGCLDFAKSKEVKLNDEILSDIEAGKDFSNWYIDHINDSFFSKKLSQTKEFQILTNHISPYSLTILKTGFPDNSRTKVILDKKSLNESIQLLESKGIETANNTVATEIELRNGYFFSYYVYDIRKWNLGKKYCLILELSVMKPIPDSYVPGKFGVAILRYNKYY